MSEEPKKPLNFYDFYDFKEGSNAEYSDSHFVNHSLREIVIVFGRMNPPHQKAKVVSQLILSPLHALELVHNIQSQLKALEEDNKKEKPGDPGPSGPRF